MKVTTSKFPDLETFDKDTLTEASIPRYTARDVYLTNSEELIKYMPKDHYLFKVMHEVGEASTALNNG